VFVVGYLGDWRVAAAVLFERESLQGNTKPSRKKREEIASDAQRSVGEAGDSQPIAVDFYNQCITGDTFQTVSTRINASTTGGVMEFSAVAQPIGIRNDITPKFSENLNPTLTTRNNLAVAQPIPVFAGEHPQKGVSIDVCPTLPAAMGMGGGHTPLVPHPVAQPIAFKVRGGCEGGGKGYLGQEDQAFTISAMQDQQIAQPIAVDTYNYTTNDHTTQTIRSQSDTEHIGAVLHSMAIRRLTPKECERLQGFPDDWTKIPYRNKPADQCPDGPRYKACGNSMAVPVMRWIGERINLIESML
jgi:DNA (cytosine-5)-methyltransferase 1